MTTLITASSSAGIVGTCDARCYNATGDTCACICYGLNHGKGEEFAITFTDHLCEIMAQQIKMRYPHVTLVTFHQPTVEMTFHPAKPKINAHESPSQNEGPDRNESDR